MFKVVFSCNSSLIRVITNGQILYLGKKLYTNKIRCFFLLRIRVMYTFSYGEMFTKQFLTDITRKWLLSNRDLRTVICSVE